MKLYFVECTDSKLRDSYWNQVDKGKINMANSFMVYRGDGYKLNIGYLKSIKKLDNAEIYTNDETLLELREYFFRDGFWNIWKWTGEEWQLISKRSSKNLLKEN